MFSPEASIMYLGGSLRAVLISSNLGRTPYCMKPSTFSPTPSMRFLPIVSRSSVVAHLSCASLISLQVPESVPNSSAMLPRKPSEEFTFSLVIFSSFWGLNTAAFAFGLFAAAFHLVVHGLLFGVVSGPEFEQATESFGEFFADFKSGFYHL